MKIYYTYMMYPINIYKTVMEMCCAILDTFLVRFLHFNG